MIFIFIEVFFQVETINVIMNYKTGCKQIIIVSMKFYPNYAEQQAQRQSFYVEGGREKLHVR